MNTRSKVLLTPVAAIVLAGTAFLGTLSAKALHKSPHGFNPPQCTWWADRRCAENGWDLHFKHDHGRDAWTWPALLINGTEIVNPPPGCIAVFAPWTGASVGHVAIVESTGENSFTISHANYRVGETARSVENIPIRYATMRFSPSEPGWATFEGGILKYRIVFIARK